MMLVLLSLLYNMAILVAMSVLSGFLKPLCRKFRSNWAEPVAQGLLFGLAGIIGMLQPVVMGDGIIFDGRSVMLSLCGLFFGPIAAGIAGGMILTCRIILGGLGVYMGSSVIIASTVIGLIYHKTWIKCRAISLKNLLLMGFFVHVVMLLLMFTLPGRIGLSLIRSIGPLILIGYPLTTILIGKVLVNQDFTYTSLGALQESETKNRSLINAIPDTILINEKDGKFIEVHEATPLIFLDTESPINKYPSDVFPEAIGPLFTQALKDALKHGAIQELHFNLPNQERFFEARVVPNSPDTTITLIRDITTQKLAEKSLLASETTLRAITDAAKDAILMMDAHGDISYWNPAATRIFGYTVTEALGLNFHRLIMPKRGHKARLALDTENGVNLDTITTAQGLHKDGTEIPVEISLSTLKLNDAWYSVGIIRDISERTKIDLENNALQAQLLQSQKMEILGSLASGIAHDMNNVLSAVLGTASASKEKYPLEGAFDIIIQAAERGGKMVKRLLTLARKNPTEEEITNVNFNEIILEEVGLLERTTLARVQIQVQLEPNLAPILGNSNLLVHALMNLCVNAVDAMPDNGILTLSTKNLGKHIEVAVKDTGTGMSPEVVKKAMEPFFTTKKVGEGTGLGLSMVKHTVEAHNGTIRITSVVDEGTCISLVFPISTSTPKEKILTVLSETVPPMDILLVDDDDLIQYACRLLLETMGHQVVVASRGQEAVDILQKGYRPHLVILDMNMPGLSGLETLPLIRNILPEVYVLMATGQIDAPIQDVLSAYHSVKLLAKPYHMQELKNYLSEVTTYLEVKP